MKESIALGRVVDLEITAERSAAIGGIVLTVAYAILGVTLFRLRPGPALLGGLFASFLHFLSEIWHQSGHARAARSTGYPMEGIHLWGVLGTSIYPDNEPALEPEIHVVRAMGGPKASLKATLAGGLITALTKPIGGVLHMVAMVFTLENLLIFTIGAFLPLRRLETDGTILLRYRLTHRRRGVTIQE